MSFSKIIDTIFFQIFKTLVALKWFFGIIVLILIFKWVLAFFQQKKYRRWLEQQKTLNDLIHNLRPDEFEDYVGNLFRKMGYRVDVIGGIHQADGGFDVKAEKDGKKYYIQVKKYGLHNPVHVQQIREFFGALKADHPDAEGIFITTSYFTYNFFHTARVFANRVGIKLIDGRKLLDLINQFN